MKILLTRSSGYVGCRLLPLPAEAGHQIVCLVRDKKGVDWDNFTSGLLESITVIEIDLSESNISTSIFSRHRCHILSRTLTRNHSAKALFLLYENLHS